MTETVDPAAITAKGCRWVRADDGRIVEYSVTGSMRANARIVVAGYFAVTQEPTAWTDAYESLNVRMINVSLPGLGMSSLHPGRRVAEWPGTDLDPILEVEDVRDFDVYGVSYGTIHAMAVAQHHGPGRVRTMGLRVPYFGLPLSEELGLPDGQPRLPVTEEVQRNTLDVRRWRVGFGRGMGLPAHEGDEDLEPPEAFKALQEAMAEPGARSYAAMSRDYPEELETLARNTIPVNALMYMMARDVALDLPGLDPRDVELSGDRVVVWYAADDEDCPPSHGKWLAEHFRSRTRVFDGYGHIGGALIDHGGFLAELTRP